MKSQIPRIEARHYESLSWDTVTCRLCPHLCAIAPSRSGVCGVRSNRDGRLYLDSWGKISTAAVVRETDLPLYHFAPARKWLRVGMQGCNFRCTFCNTFRHSHLASGRLATIEPEDVIAKALSLGTFGVSFGINEPLVAHEYVVEVLRLARAAGLATHLATNGAWLDDPFEEIVATTDAITFGIKGFDENQLMLECGGQLEIVLQNALAAVTRGVHVELSYLVIEADEGWREELRRFGEWVEGLGVETPVILLALESDFTWTRAATSSAALREAHDFLAQSLPHVFAEAASFNLKHTSCRGCGKVLIRRGVTGTVVIPGGESQCPDCGYPVPWSDRSDGPGG